MPEEDGVSVLQIGQPETQESVVSRPWPWPRPSLGRALFLPRDFSPMLMGALGAGVNNFFLVSLFFFFFFKGTMVASLEYRKTNGALGREELSFQLGVMGESGCTTVYVFSLSVVRGESTDQLELGRQDMGSLGEEVSSSFSS